MASTRHDWILSFSGTFPHTATTTSASSSARVSNSPAATVHCCRTPNQMADSAQLASRMAPKTRIRRPMYRSTFCQ
jgi:hypothetical protein